MKQSEKSENQIKNASIENEEILVLPLAFEIRTWEDLARALMAERGEYWNIRWEDVFYDER